MFFVAASVIHRIPQLLRSIPVRSAATRPLPEKSRIVPGPIWHSVVEDFIPTSRADWFFNPVCAGENNFATTRLIGTVKLPIPIRLLDIEKKKTVNFFSKFLFLFLIHKQGQKDHQKSDYSQKGKLGEKPRAPGRRNSTPGRRCGAR